MAIKYLYNEFYKKVRYSDNESERRHFKNLKIKIGELEDKNNLQVQRHQNLQFFR